MDIIQIIQEEYIKHINEIDFENIFRDVGHECIESENLIDYLNDILVNNLKKIKDRVRVDKDNFIVHARTIKNNLLPPDINLDNLKPTYN